MRLIEHGDLRPDEMIGSWAGELGQTQMMPSEYFKYAVGAIDGFLGLKTRQAVKAMQLKYRLPADSYPTAEPLARMAR